MLPTKPINGETSKHINQKKIPGLTVFLPEHTTHVKAAAVAARDRNTQSLSFRVTIWLESPEHCLSLTILFGTRSLGRPFQTAGGVLQGVGWEGFIYFQTKRV